MSPAANVLAESHVQIPTDREAVLEGDLILPANATAVVLFAHGSGSSRHSPRNQAVAMALQDAGLGTLLMDLLTKEEERADEWSGHLRFNIPFLAERLIVATEWLAKEESTASKSIGYFGASTGAGAALLAAAQHPRHLRAIVSRGGRPDLAGPALGLVSVPTLLIVGGHDFQVLKFNKQALAELTCEKQLEIVPDATHLFEEPGTLEQVSLLAREWFLRHLHDEGT